MRERRTAKATPRDGAARVRTDGRVSRAWETIGVAMTRHSPAPARVGGGIGPASADLIETSRPEPGPDRDRREDPERRRDCPEPPGSGSVWRGRRPGALRLRAGKSGDGGCVAHRPVVAGRYGDIADSGEMGTPVRRSLPLAGPVKTGWRKGVDAWPRVYSDRREFVRGVAQPGRAGRHVRADRGKLSFPAAWRMAEWHSPDVERGWNEAGGRFRTGHDRMRRIPVPHAAESPRRRRGGEQGESASARDWVSGQFQVDPVTVFGCSAALRHGSSDA